jgi:hypothetical protein
MLNIGAVVLCANPLSLLNQPDLLNELNQLALQVDFIPQFAGTFKGNDPPGPQHEIGASGRIPASARFFFLHAEFTKPRDQHVLAPFQPLLDNLQQAFDDFDRFLFGEPDFVNCGDNVILRQCHGASYTHFRWMLAPVRFRLRGLNSCDSNRLRGNRWAGSTVAQ